MKENNADNSSLKDDKKNDSESNFPQKKQISNQSTSDINDSQKKQGLNNNQRNEKSGSFRKDKKRSTRKPYTDSKPRLKYFMMAPKRVIKVVRGGRRVSFSIFVIAGDGNGKVGWGFGKAMEVMEARKKAYAAAEKLLIQLPRYQKRTIHHDIEIKKNGIHLIIRRAKRGNGVRVPWVIRDICQAVGYEDMNAKSCGVNDPIKMAIATIMGLRAIMLSRRMYNTLYHSKESIITQKEQAREQIK